MSRCENCSKISLKSIFRHEQNTLERLSVLVGGSTDVEDDEDEDHGEGVRRLPEQPSAVLIANDELELERSAEAGCDLCGMAWQALYFVHRSEATRTPKLPPHSRICLVPNYNGTIWVSSACSTYGCGLLDLASSESLIVNRDGGPNGSAEAVELKEVTDRAHAMTADQSHIFNRDLDYFSDLAQGWLEVCDSQHDCLSIRTEPKPSNQVHEHSNISQSVSASKSVNDFSLCSTNEAQSDFEFLPPRLIHIRGDVSNPDLRLVETTSLEMKLGKKVRYCALSYCWGGSHQHSTTQINLADRFERIQYEELPRTLRDAIQLTFNTQVEYIWIDSLCIVQAHSAEAAPDWLKHVSIMGLIYERSYYTLLASNSPNAGSGFVHRENAYFARFGVRACRIPFTSAKTSPYLTYFFDHRSLNTYWRREAIPAPLGKRAWALQESILSPRRLIFKDTGVEFECKRKRAHETRPFILERLPYGDAHRNYLAISKATRYGWYDLVTDFCTLELSFDADKLAAFEGIAQEYCRRNDASELFVAGVRRSACARDLCWFNTSDSSARNSSFPSWSWASTVRAVIKYPGFWPDAITKLALESGEVELQNLTITRADWVRVGSPEFAATWDTTKNQGDIPPQASISVRGAHGRLSGIRLLDFHQTKDSSVDYKLYHEGHPAVFYKDPGSVISPQRNYKWLVSRTGDGGHGPISWAIILEAADQQELSWRRIGVLTIKQLRDLGPKYPFEEGLDSSERHGETTEAEHLSSPALEQGDLILV